MNSPGITTQIKSNAEIAPFKAQKQIKIVKEPHETLYNNNREFQPKIVKNEPKYYRIEEIQDPMLLLNSLRRENGIPETSSNGYST